MKRGAIADPSEAVPGSGLPGWLAASLPTLVEMLRYAIKREATYPSRPELYRRLEAIETAARLLKAELNDLQISALLIDGDELIENENEMYHGLCDIADRAARVRARHPRKPGRGLLYPDASAGPNTMGLCALMVSVVWHEESRKWPGENNAGAHQVCEALWKAAEGPPRPGWGKPDSVVVWRDHLRAAKQYWPPHPAGTRITRILAPPIGRRPAPSKGRLARYYDHPHSHPEGYRPRTSLDQDPAAIEIEEGGKKTE